MALEKIPKEEKAFDYGKFFSFDCGHKHVHGELVVDLHAWGIAVTLSCRPWKKFGNKLGGHFGLLVGPLHFTLYFHP